MCQGLNSHYLHIIGDKLINPIVGVYIPIIRIPIKGGMSPIPNKTRLLTMAHVSYLDLCDFSRQWSRLFPKPIILKLWFATLLRWLEKIFLPNGGEKMVIYRIIPKTSPEKHIQVIGNSIQLHESQNWFVDYEIWNLYQNTTLKHKSSKTILNIPSHQTQINPTLGSCRATDKCASKRPVTPSGRWLVQWFCGSSPKSLETSAPPKQM